MSPTSRICSRRARGRVDSWWSYSDVARQKARGASGASRSPLQPAATERDANDRAESRAAGTHRSIVTDRGGCRGVVACGDMRLRRRRRQGPAFQYSRWDGSQRGFDIDADSLLEEMSDDLLYHGDLNAALRRLMQQGFHDRDGERLMGMREMLEKLRQRRREELERRDLGGVYDDIAEKLQEVVEQEREGIEPARRRGARVGRPAAPGDRRGPRRAATAASSSSCRPTSPVACRRCRTTTSWTTPPASGSRS